MVAQNRAASHNYLILEKHEAGLVLHGTEVKALREGKANIRDAYVDFRPGGAWLVNAHIAQYSPGGAWNHEPIASRQLRLHKTEIHRPHSGPHRRGGSVRRRTAAQARQERGTDRQDAGIHPRSLALWPPSRSSPSRRSREARAVQFRNSSQGCRRCPAVSEVSLRQELRSS